MRGKLLIVSDTPFFKSENEVSIFEPTLREIEEVADLFSEVVWISYSRGNSSSANSRLPIAKNLQVRVLPDYRGGSTWLKKLKVLFSLPLQLWIIGNAIRGFDMVHARGPSVPALLVLLLAFLSRRPVYWYKYAGNWIERSSPLAFRAQRVLLRLYSGKRFRVTVNGAWPGLPSTFLNWNNPCLTEAEWLTASKARKGYDGNWRFCFVGNLDPFKGALRFVRALMASQALRGKIEGVWIVGDGPERVVLEELRGKVGFPLHLTGYLARPVIFEQVYSSCHFLVLPSESEGFPKVVAEASAHHCIPICTRVSAIDQHIRQGVNGFLLENSDEQEMEKFFSDLPAIPAAALSVIADQAARDAREFTYERYRARITSELLPLLEAR